MPDPSPGCRELVSYELLFYMVDCDIETVIKYILQI